MSRTLSERLRIEFSLPDDRIDVVFNGVDLEVFRTVRTPPPHPRRALLFNSFHAPGGAVARALEQACGLSGLQFEAAGTRFGRRFLHPENELPEFDLVFASGRSAIEAMACGCAVVVIGRSSVGELVAPDNFDRLREVNFSVAANRPPPADEEIAKQLECYDPASAAAVTGRIRAEADSIKVAERLLGVYGKAMERQAAAPEDLAAEAVAMARYLRKIVPVIKATDAVQRHGGLGIPKLAAMLALEEKAEMFLREIRPPA